MIKAFLFDNGGVITSGGAGKELSEHLGEHLGIELDDAYALLLPHWVPYAEGKLSESDLWHAVEVTYGMPITQPQRGIWNRWEDMKPLPEMLELVRQLKAGGYVVGMLSNVIPNTEQEIRSHGGYDDFDFLVLSCEVGLSKPDPKIYEAAMKHLKGISPEEVVFLDDQERCLVPARDMGIQTILVINAAQAIADVKQLLAGSA